MRSMNVAAVQMRSGPEVGANLVAARRLIAEAVSAGAELVLLPEYFAMLGASLSARRAAYEEDGDGAQQRFLAETARAHGIYLIGGCVPLRSSTSGAPEAQRARSACLAYGPDGGRRARYDKIHLFQFAYGEEAYDEAQMIEAGNTPVTFAAPCGRVALSICYDLRFPELYRSFGAVALTVVPAAFTATTGRAHWEVLLRARAIENQCYVLAAGQDGSHMNRHETYGHSMLIDPWGDILSCLPHGEGVVSGTVDPARIEKVRGCLPALRHRRLSGHR
ncbi:MAG: carbon-nitrogen hydrolase family protein [Desulfobulbaceae bacterium]|jgi:nitrilase|nr:carbon-nitrogen hydrolase family protein [Desulfobulbaceae bacterium]